MIGFKFVGQLLDLARSGRRRAGADLVLASEESHGYLTTTDLRDKDAASGAYIIAHLHALLRSTGPDAVGLPDGGVRRRPACTSSTAGRWCCSAPTGRRRSRP